ncbi:flavin-containing monooxygenase [Corynebacterium auris]|uniref:flavin-containing monooxygenase n=1 Tax=Corynebacterium auris TaxID=44750 RepID=UPI0025B42569|nr:NAD(P)/FAD-dependent oxidoreductase [Corynebacterium auris]WJY69018.1 4-hydroxyacetophenone monooxygenase [Corynebacterium auris]
MSNEHIYNAIIIGAGFSGLGQGAQFVQDGVDNFLILEKEERLGGVWRDNTYPGAACDTQSVIYCFSYFLHLGASRMFCSHDELLRYLDNLAAEFGLEQYLRTSQLVTRAEWDEDNKVWRVFIADGTEYLTRMLIPAWGQLGTPSIPNFEGLDTFEGDYFHSARWNHDIDLKGKRVASVGAAASAVQYIPEIAPEVAQLTVFQRSANYILPRNQRVFTDEELAAFQRDPDVYRELRHSIHDEREAGFERTRRQTDAAAEGMRLAKEHLESQIQDPELREKFTPDFDFGCKRILRTDDFYPVFNRDNVTLITEGIERITPKGIVTSDGVEHEFDVLIFGTGFHSQAFQAGTEIIGRDGLSLDDRWGNSPEAYLGMTVDGFPNLFILYGPNTNLNHHSIVTMLEAQNRYVRQALSLLLDGHDDVFEVRPDTLRSFNEHVQDDLSKSAYSSDCSSWYKNEDGKVINNWSGTVAEYHALTAEFNPEDFLSGESELAGQGAK